MTGALRAGFDIVPPDCILLTLFPNMANTKSAAKRARQTPRRTLVNSRVDSRVKTAKRKLRDLIQAGDVAGAAEAYKAAISTLDKAAKRGVIHKNVVSRNKSRLLKAVKGIGAAAKKE